MEYKGNSFIYSSTAQTKLQGLLEHNIQDYKLEINEKSLP